MRTARFTMSAALVLLMTIPGSWAFEGISYAWADEFTLTFGVDGDVLKPIAAEIRSTSDTNGDDWVDKFERPGGLAEIKDRIEGDPFHGSLRVNGEPPLDVNVLRLDVAGLQGSVFQSDQLSVNATAKISFDTPPSSEYILRRVTTEDDWLRAYRFDALNGWEFYAVQGLGEQRVPAKSIVGLASEDQNLELRMRPSQNPSGNELSSPHPLVAVGLLSLLAMVSNRRLASGRCFKGNRTKPSTRPLRDG